MIYKNLKQVIHKADLCVIGGGISGMCAAIAAARHGAKVVLMHDRPVLGGNASSEIRMWICGAHGDNNRETGILEEILLENLYRNGTQPNFSIWDSVLYEKVAFEPNITLLLNCSCNFAEMDGDRIRAARGWQLTSETWHLVEAEYFADCSGDGILAPFSGAEFRVGREASSEFDESIAPEKADSKTMGMSCLIQMREYPQPQNFIPPSWAYKYPDHQSLQNRNHDIRGQNFWWLEVGGVHDSIHDTEKMRDELLKIAFGVLDHIKNHGDHGAENWGVEWIGFLPGKRESRRYVGDHILTQNDVRAEGKFDDIVAYGGWSMDDHHPDGFYHPGRPTIFHQAPSPYGIPFRCLYSKNISNLFFAGRNISCTHSAMSSTRVMATCATMGHAVGVAAALCAQRKLTPRKLGQNATVELQETLMDDDCYLPWKARRVPDIAKFAELSTNSGTDPEPVRNGIDRQIGNCANCWEASPGQWIQYTFPKPHRISSIRLVFDSNLNRRVSSMPCSFPLSGHPNFRTPETLVKSFTVEYLDDKGEWRQAVHSDANYQRFAKFAVDISAVAVKLTVESTHGSVSARVFSFEPGD